MSLVRAQRNMPCSPAQREHKPINLGAIRSCGESFGIMSRKKVMIVEDDVGNGHALVAAFEMMGFVGVLVTSIEEARRTFDESIHMILTDVDLPDGNGIRFSQEIALISPCTPIVVMSGYDREEMALGVGAIAFFRKPLDLGALIALATDLVGKANLVRHLRLV